MARTADHALRREQISGAALNQALTGGLASVTIASVAAGAGVSVGLVQHYFASKEDLLQRVYRDLLAGVDQRITEIVSAGERQRLTIRQLATAALVEMLPIGPERVREAEVRRAFQSLSVADDRIRASTREHDLALRSRMLAVVRNGRVCGESATDRAAEEIAADLWASVVGCATAMLADPEFPGSVVLPLAVRRAFPHPCNRQS